MARKPNLTSPVAVLRTVLGLTAGEFARLVGAGKSTIQHVETGDRALKADLADAIHLATGFPRDWLDQDKITLEQAREWMTGRDEQTRFQPRSNLEREASGGPQWFGTATFPSEFSRLEAIFYLVGLKATNPHLVLLAIERLESELISRFKLSHKEVESLSLEIRAQRKSGKWTAGGPGRLKLTRAFLSRHPRLKSAAISRPLAPASRGRGGCKVR